MCVPVDTPISIFEIIGRSVYCPSQVNKKGKIKNGCFYPRNKSDESGNFTNKISMVRICYGVEGSKVVLTPNVKYALNFRRNRIFKGFLILRVADLGLVTVEVEPAATAANPFHMHLVLKDYREPFRTVESVTDVLPVKYRALLDRLRRSAYYIEFNDEIPVDLLSPDVCSLCANRIMLDK